MNRIPALLAAVLVTSMYGASAQAASDGKIYPAMMCRPTAASASNWTVDSYGRMYNSSTTATLTIVCPVLDDETDTSTSSNDISVDVYYIDASAGTSLSCTFTSRDIVTNVTSDYDTYTTSAFASAAVQTMSLGALVAGDWGDDFAYIKCTLPAKDTSLGYSYLVAYRVDEDAS